MESTRGNDEQHKSLSALIFGAAVIILLTFMPFLLVAQAEAEEFSDALAGEKFTDPSILVEMSGDWVKQSIKHEEADKGTDLVMILNQQVYDTFLPLIQKYAADNSLRIIAKEGICGNSSGKLIRKSADVAMFCCAAGKLDRLPGLKFHTLGIASIALIVNQDNPLNSLSLTDARRIFMGEAYNWSEFKDDKGNSGPRLPIRVVARLHCKKRPGHWRLLLDNEDLFSPRLNEVGVIEDMVTMITTNRGAIGYETLWMARKFSKKRQAKALEIDGFSPSNFDALLSGKYPLYRVFTITTWEGEGLVNPHAKKLVKHLISVIESTQDKVGIVPSSRLRQTGWKFKENELVGEPE